MLFASTSWAQTSDKSILNIDEQRFHRRAVEAAYWGMPTVNIWAMREGYKRDAGVTANSVLYFSKPHFHDQTRRGFHHHGGSGC